MLERLVDAVRREPYPVYRVLRRLAPVLRLRPGVWALFDHESVQRALHDPEVFSSRAAPPGGAPLDWLIFQDPPRHTRLRALILRAFTPGAVAGLEPRIAALTHGLIDAVIERGELDLVADFSARLPVLVILELLGMPASDEPRVAGWSDAIMHLADTIFGGERAARAKANYVLAKEQMTAHLTGLLDRARPGLLGRLAEAEIEGQRLSIEEILAFFQLLLFAGTETTSGLIANAVLCFLEHPGQLARLRREPALLPAAIEEVLRYRTPVQLVFRSTTRAVTLRRREIPAGALVLAIVGSANRDGARFPSPARFDLARAPVPHLAFGHGLHFCIGAALARLEARVALSALLERMPGLRRATMGRWQPRTGLNVHGPRSLPLRFQPAARSRNSSARS